MNRIDILLILLFHIAKGGAPWDYTVNGEDTWHINYPTCKGMKQSPIDIISSKSKYNKELKPFSFHNYDRQHKWLIKKTGPTSKSFSKYSKNSVIRNFIIRTRFSSSTI